MRFDRRNNEGNAREDRIEGVKLNIPPFKEKIHQLYIMSLSSMIRLRHWSQQLKERNKEFLNSFID